LIPSPVSCTGEGQGEGSVVSVLATFTKWRIAFFNAVSAAAGCVLAGRFDIWPVLGVFLLACGGAALNQIQERNLDAKMDRTRRRPLPAGKLSPPAAWSITGTLIVAGLMCLALTHQPVAVLLGVLALVSYNLIYTPLKRVTYYAPMIGAVVGAFPPAIGWVSVGGPVFSPALLGVVMFFVLWQVPHFWLLLLGATEDYRRGGFAVPAIDLRRVTFIWILGTATLAVMLPLFGVVRSPVAFVVLLAAAGWLGWRAGRDLLGGTSSQLVHRRGRTTKMVVPLDTQLRPAFAAINGFALTTLALIILDRIL